MTPNVPPPTKENIRAMATEIRRLAARVAELEEFVSAYRYASHNDAERLHAEAQALLKDATIGEFHESERE